MWRGWVWQGEFPSIPSLIFLPPTSAGLCCGLLLLFLQPADTEDWATGSLDQEQFRPAHDPLLTRCDGVTV